MGTYKDVVRELDTVLRLDRDDPEYNPYDIPEVVAFLLQENDEATYKIGLLRDILDGNVGCVVCGDSV